jgi:electron transfer flavoprotein-quinone oxidoreductase
MESVECIVVGGGLAGLSAAYGLACAGREVMVIERGDYSGAKNVTGGRLYMTPIRDLYPELWGEAPFERPVARELLTIAGESAETTIDIAADSFVRKSPQSYTVLRAKLDRWLAERAADKGAMVVPNMRVDALLREDGPGALPRVKGVRAGDDEIGASVVIVAEGVLGLLSSVAGLRERPTAVHHALGFKEVIELAPEVIEERWHLRPGEGAAQLLVGAPTRQMSGGGFLYTNRDSVSLGLVVGLDQLRLRSDLEAWQLLDEFKSLPCVAPLIAGGTVLEYSAHTIAEGGIRQVPRLFGDGYLLTGDAAGLSLNALLTVRGMDLAIASGYHAAQSALAALAAGDVSADALSVYEARLKASFVLRDLEAAKAVPDLLANPRLFAKYPDAICRLLTDLYTVGPVSTGKFSRRVLRSLRRDFASISTAKDLWSLLKV